MNKFHEYGNQLSDEQRELAVKRGQLDGLSADFTSNNPILLVTQQLGYILGVFEKLGASEKALEEFERDVFHALGRLANPPEDTPLVLLVAFPDGTSEPWSGGN